MWSHHGRCGTTMHGMHGGGLRGLIGKIRGEGRVVTQRPPLVRGHALSSHHRRPSRLRILRVTPSAPGAYPGCSDDPETDATLRALLGCGVTTFVCLQSEFSLHTPEATWRAGQGLRPYIRDAQRLALASHAATPPPCAPRLHFLHLRIPDGGVTSDAAILQLTLDCAARVLSGGGERERERGEGFWLLAGTAASGVDALIAV